FKPGAFARPMNFIYKYWSNTYEKNNTFGFLVSVGCQPGGRLFGDDYQNPDVYQWACSQCVFPTPVEIG
ncbi:hypothetical protein, partial [Pseudomonas syringae]|uniref:hypothetical protein n=1 Tax=Pseudomonas syringae TaxID=317 RepID=UPI001F1D1105